MEPNFSFAFVFTPLHRLKFGPDIMSLGNFPEKNTLMVLIALTTGGPIALADPRMVSRRPWLSASSIDFGFIPSDDSDA